ncbi:MAG TPA: PEP/pyruvate-binding domain-containing protein [Gaiellaceae bacterium]
MIGGKAEGLARLQELGLPVPPYVAIPVGGDVDERAVAELGEPLAVRSSALGEDGAGKSAAGQYETVLGVTRDRLQDAIARVRSSTERARAYGGSADVGVVVQRQVQATRAGVAFSRDPVTGADEVVIECALGGGEAVVSGSVTPDRYRVRDGVVHARAAGSVRTLRDDEAEALAAVVRRAEAGFGSAVDVEFCFDGRELWLVQCRPITTLR